MQNPCKKNEQKANLWLSVLISENSYVFVCIQNNKIHDLTNMYYLL